MREKLTPLLLRPETGALISVLAVVTVFSSLSPYFLAPLTILGILTIASELGMVTVGVALLLISGEFNLAVSSIYCLSPIVLTMLANNGINVAVAALTGLAVAALVGYVEGLIVVKTKVHSFIVSLGFMMFLRGVDLVITGGVPLDYYGPEYFLKIFNGRLFGNARTSLLWLLATIGLFTVILHATKYGNWCYATGGNPTVAKEVGVNTDRVKVLNFILSSVLAGLAGYLSLSRIAVVDPTLGYGLELESIAAAVIGGCSLLGGFGSIIGASLGALIIAMTRVGLVLAGANPYWYQAFLGLILLASIIINLRIMKKILSFR
ncbi:MAG: ABC transporter permease [Thermofilum sp. ex4484_15]|nr:MAG: ABC transporter permease [Thermofilum sp. ex4484_15]